MTERRLLFAGGGTGGHLYSGVAVAQQVVELADVEPVFVGTSRGIEARVIPETSWSLELLAVSAIKGRGPVGAVRGVFTAVGALLASWRLLRRLRPAAVIGIGGYASGPTVLAAALAGYPTAIIEQNVIPGFTNRVLSRLVRRIYVPSEAAVGHFPRSARRRIVVSGNPIRTKVIEQVAASQNTPGEAPHILIFGGSQGARRINEAVIAALPRLAGLGVTITHQTGKLDFDKVHAAYQAAGVEADVRAYIDDMGEAYARADLIVCRAGASTLAEITSIGKPSLLVPYPHAIYNHQELNARALAERGAAAWILDGELDGASLVERVQGLLSKPDTLTRMAKKAREAGHPEAARRIALEVLEMAKVKGSNSAPDNNHMGGGDHDQSAGTGGGSMAAPVTVTHNQTPTVTHTERGTVVETIVVRVNRPEPPPTREGLTAEIEDLLEELGA